MKNITLNNYRLVIMGTALLLGFVELVIGGLIMGTLLDSFTQEQTSNQETSTNATSILFEQDIAQVDEVDLRNHAENLNIDGTIELSGAEVQDLVFMREEEKLAHDVYTYLYEKWDLTIFSNIASSEQRHTDSIASLLAAYNIKDPMLAGIGNFTNDTLDKLYKDLIEEGSKSITSALSVGALIEDLDVTDLTSAMANTNNPSILTVYENLQRGSRNHLRSFTDQLSRYGESYEPSYLSETEYNEIILGGHERGSGNSAGGQGQHRGMN